MADARYIKGTISYTPEIDEISRKFAPRKQKANAEEKVGPIMLESRGWMGGAVIKSIRGGLGNCRRNTLVVRANTTYYAPTAAQMNTRTMFNKVVAGRAAILEDLTQITQVQAKWNEARNDARKTLNGVSAYGYTYKGWIFAVQYAGCKESSSYDATKFPTAFDA